MNNKHAALLATLILLLANLSANTSEAHFPFLATDSDGHAVMWFGESLDDRTYPMPPSIQSVQLYRSVSDGPIAVRAEESEDFAGVRAIKPSDSTSKIVGVVTYGIYHGTKLTYFVEHRPQTDLGEWPNELNKKSALQTQMELLHDQSIRVLVLLENRPLPNKDVKLYNSDGSVSATRQSASDGSVRFTAGEVKPGLNAILVEMVDDQAKGEYEGEPYESETHYLTSTFRIDEASTSTISAKSNAMITPANLPDLPEELTSFGAAFSGTTLYVYGGHTGNAHSYSTAEQSDRFWCLDISAGKNGQWTALPGGPALQGLALVAHQGRLIRIGGFTAMNGPGEDSDLRSQDSVASFDPATNQWTPLAALPEGRSSLDAAVVGDTVYVCGGWKLDGESDESVWHQTAWSLDLRDAKSTWEPIQTPPFQRRAISVAAHDGKLYVIGGMGHDNGPTTRVDVYDPSTDSWKESPSLPGKDMAGFGTASFATGGNLYTSTMDGFVHRLSKDGSQWEPLCKLDPPRFFHRMLPASDSELLIIGGANMEIGKFTNIDVVRLLP